MSDWAGVAMTAIACGSICFIFWAASRTPAPPKRCEPKVTPPMWTREVRHEVPEKDAPKDS